MTSYVWINLFLYNIEYQNLSSLNDTVQLLTLGKGLSDILVRQKLNYTWKSLKIVYFCGLHI